jgi:hypothetical protein
LGKLAYVETSLSLQSVVRMRARPGSFKISQFKIQNGSSWIVNLSSFSLFPSR